MLFFIFISSIICYLDPNKIKYAIDAGSPYYYKDRQKVLYRYDQNYEKGQQAQISFQYNLEQQHHLIPLQYLDYKTFQTERITNEYDYFTYSLNLRLNGNYTLLLGFIEVFDYFNENQYEFKSQRQFDIYFESYPVREQVDIIKEAGGQAIPVYYAIEFQYKEKQIFIYNNSVCEIPDTKLSFDIHFKGKGAKVSSVILYSGTVEDIIFDLESALLSKDQIEATFITQHDFIKTMKQKALRYAMKMKVKDNNLNSLMSSYLSPFQYIIQNYEFGQNTHCEASQNVMENTTLELFIESIFYFLLIPLGNSIIISAEFLLNNKILVLILIANFTLLYFCLSAPKQNIFNVSQGYNNMVYYLIIQGLNEMDFNQQAASPKSRGLKIKKKKK